jgi:hypothetical protein
MRKSCSGTFYDQMVHNVREGRKFSFQQRFGSRVSKSSRLTVKATSPMKCHACEHLDLLKIVDVVFTKYLGREYLVLLTGKFYILLKILKDSLGTRIPEWPCCYALQIQILLFLSLICAKCGAEIINEWATSSKRDINCRYIWKRDVYCFSLVLLQIHDLATL